MKGSKNTSLDLLRLNIERSNLRVKNRESEHREFKAKFENKNIPRYAKTMAAYANRDGGVLFFGIKDGPRELVGETESNIPDDVVISNFLKEYFQPEISFTSEQFEKYGKTIYAVVVKPLGRRPVICKKAKSIRQGQGKPEKVVLREGAVYYRYSASTEEIKFAELRSMLDSEREDYFRSMIDNISLLNQVGHDKAAVVDAHELNGNDQDASVYITKDTAKNLNWIDRGRFVEDASEGKNAYYVVRNVEIRQGIEVPKPTDFAKTHPLTKTALMSGVKINGIDFEAITWNLGINNNSTFHIPTSHGKNRLHKYTSKAKDKILETYPLDMDKKERKFLISFVTQEYKKASREAQNASSRAWSP